MQDKMYIYGLLDPTVSQIRYIGYTDDVNERYPAHLARKRIKVVRVGCASMIPNCKLC